MCRNKEERKKSIKREFLAYKMSCDWGKVRGEREVKM